MLSINVYVALELQDIVLLMNQLQTGRIVQIRGGLVSYLLLTHLSEVILSSEAAAPKASVTEGAVANCAVCKDVAKAGVGDGDGWRGWRLRQLGATGVDAKVRLTGYVARSILAPLRHPGLYVAIGELQQRRKHKDQAALLSDFFMHIILFLFFLWIFFSILAWILVI